MIYAHTSYTSQEPLKVGDKVKLVRTDGDTWFTHEKLESLELPYYTVTEVDYYPNWIRLKELEFKHRSVNFERV